MSPRFLQARKGQSLVEMALLIPLLLLFSVVTIDLGRGIYYYSAIYNAAREGARYGIVHQNPYNTVPVNTGNIKLEAEKYTIGLDPTRITVSIASPIVSDTLKVTVTYKFQLVTPLAHLVTGKNYFSLSSTSTMRIER